MFPVRKEVPHIFISHSHNDIENKNFYTLIGLLQEKFGINCFVDAWVWGNYNDLLKIIYNYYKEQHGEQISEENKKFLSTKIEALLLKRLHNIMDETETIFLLKSHNSTPRESQTNSSWIYLENTAVSFLRRKTPERELQVSIESYRSQEEREQNFINKLFFPLKNLPKLNSQKIIN